MELRSPDPACNPYLAIAACLAAGLDGIERGLTPPPEIPGNIYEMDAATRSAFGIETLPRTLEEALEAMKQDQLVMDVLGEHVASHYLAGGRACGLPLSGRQAAGVGGVPDPGVQLGD